jgi:hypothetical protein
MYIPDDARFLEFYVALFNSSLANAWYKVRDVNRAIKLCILEDLPIIFDRNAWMGIGALAQECVRLRTIMHKASDQGPISEDRMLSGTSSSLRAWQTTVNQIDTAVFDLYGVPQPGRTAISEFVQARVF